MRVIFCLICLLFCSCTPVSDTTEYLSKVNTLNNKIAEVKTQYLSIKDLTINKSDIFTEEEWSDLVIFDSLVKLIIEKLDKNGGKDFDVNEIKYLWNLTSDSYIKIRKIAFNHFNEFDEVTKNKILNFNGVVVIVDDMINNNEITPSTLYVIAEVLVFSLKIAKCII